MLQQAYRKYKEAVSANSNYRDNADRNSYTWIEATGTFLLKRILSSVLG